MTDIASDDGGEHGQSKDTNGPSDTASRPETARTGLSSLRNPLAQNRPSQSRLSGKRGSVGASSIAGSTASARPPSSTRSHVPSLTSHAFFHPMSSQKLQAQRGASRPPTLLRQQSTPDDEPRDANDGATERGGAENQTPIAQLTREAGDGGAVRAPPSRGSEFTEQETLGRITANTSPTHGHYPAGSLSESVRPLQTKTAEKGKGLSVGVDRNYKAPGNLPTPIKSPRSFRGSFLLPTKGDSSQVGANRSIQGAEKLESVASTPQLSPSVANTAARARDDQIALRVGKNFEYFEGNTVFFLGGRLQNARSRPINIATGTFVVVPCVLFFVFSAPWLWSNISPAIPITFAYLSFVCFSSFFHASVSDPGV